MWQPIRARTVAVRRPCSSDARSPRTAPGPSLARPRSWSKSTSSRIAGVASAHVYAVADIITVEVPSHLRSHPEPLKLTLLAALVYERQREITGTLADPLISTVQRIGAHAEREITQELVREFRKVAGKETLLFRLAEAAIARRDDTGRAVLYPVAGEKTLRDLVAGSRPGGTPPDSIRDLRTCQPNSTPGLRMPAGSNYDIDAVARLALTRA